MRDRMRRRAVDLIDQLRGLSDRIAKQVDQIATEEAAKTAFVMPFIQALGFNVFDPTEVVPEYTADVATKKGEKVDYAIMIDGEPAILFECKWEGPELDDKHSGQLYRYFSVTKARIAVLTNGVVYRFYSDIDDKNKMDAKPFLVLDMRSPSEQMVTELRRLCKESFDLDQMLTAAGELKYMREIKGILSSEMAEPTEDFVRFFFARVASGRRLTEGAREQFSELIKKGLAQFVRENVDRRLQSALAGGREEEEQGDAAPVAEADKPEEVSEIETTQEELEGFYVVKSILRGAIDPGRVTYRDAKTYFSVLIDNNNRKPVCRLWLNGVRKKHMSLFDAEKKERKVEIASIDGIFEHADALRATVAAYSSESSAEGG